jgi:hypothetical protein
MGICLGFGVWSGEGGVYYSRYRKIGSFEPSNTKNG